MVVVVVVLKMVTIMFLDIYRAKMMALMMLRISAVKMPTIIMVIMVMVMMTKHRPKMVILRW